MCFYGKTTDSYKELIMTKNKCRCCGRKYSIIPNMSGLCSHCQKLPGFKHNYETNEILMRKDLLKVNERTL